MKFLSKICLVLALALTCCTSNHHRQKQWEGVVHQYRVHQSDNSWLWYYVLFSSHGNNYYYYSSPSQITSGNFSSYKFTESTTMPFDPNDKTEVETLANEDVAANDLPSDLSNGSEIQGDEVEVDATGSDGSSIQGDDESEPTTSEPSGSGDEPSAEPSSEPSSDPGESGGSDGSSSGSSDD